MRGSISTPGPQTIKYGGSGLFQLTQALLLQMSINAHILITHTHWDHIHGLPFCTPFYILGNKLTLYGGQDSNTGEGIERTSKIQMQHSFFPIVESELKADVCYKTVIAGEKFKIASAMITPIVLNHPVINFGYPIDCDGKSLFLPVIMNNQLIIKILMIRNI